MSQLRQKHDQRASLHTQMTAIVDGARRAKRNLTAEENTRFDRMDEDLVALTEDITRLEKHEAHGRTLNGLRPVALEDIGGGQQSRHNNVQKSPYAAAFDRYLRGGMVALDADDQTLMRSGFDAQAALSPATGAGGGYLIPTGFEDKLEEARKWFGGIDQFSDTITTDTGNPLPFPTENDTNNIGEIVGPNTQVTQAYPGFNAVLMNAYKFSSKLVLVPMELLQDSAFNLDDYLARKLGIRIARIENNKFTVGTGLSEPTGVVTAAAAAGNVVQMPTGSVATITSDNLIDLEGGVDKAYRMGARYMLSDTTLRLLKKLKDTTGRPLWQPGLSSTFADGAPDKINGYQYIINNDMPSPGASQYIMAFGDYTAFKVRRVKGYMVLRLTERYADYGQVGFLCFERADSNLIDAGTHPIALLQNSAT